MFKKYLFYLLANLVKVIRGELAAGNNNENIIQSFKVGMIILYREHLFQDLIKRQDEEISELKQSLKKMGFENEELQQQIASNQSNDEIQKLQMELETAHISGQKNEATQMQLNEMQRYVET